MNINSVNTPTVEDIKLKIKNLIKEAPENWLEIVAAKTGKSESTIKSYIYNGRGRKRHLVPVLTAMSDLVEEFNKEIQKKLSE